MLLLQSYAAMSTSLSEGIHSLSRKIPSRDPEERCVTQRTRARVSNTVFVLALLIAGRCFTSSALKLSCSRTRRRNHKPSQHVDIFSQGQCASTWVLTTPRWFSCLNTPNATMRASCDSRDAFTRAETRRGDADERDTCVCVISARKTRRRRRGARSTIFS